MSAALVGVNRDKILLAWGEIFGNPVAMAAKVDRLVHHVEAGDSWWLRGKARGVLWLESGLLRRPVSSPAPPVRA
jgi:hypothetical protein